MRDLSRLVALTLFAAAVAWPMAALSQTPTAVLGSPAPDFTLVDENGASHTLSQYTGNVVVLEWTNPECPFVQGCYERSTIPETAAAFADQPVVWLAVDSTHFNTAEVNLAWKAQHGFPYPTLQDREGTVGHMYGATTTPHMFIIDQAGVLRYAGAFSNDPRGNEEESEVVNYTADAVTALLAGEAPPVSSTDPWGCSVKYEEEE